MASILFKFLGISGGKSVMLYVALSAAVGCGVLYLDAKLQRAKAQTALTALAAEQQAHDATKRAFSSYQASVQTQIEQLTASLDNLQTEYKAARRESDALGEKLARHDLGAAAARHPAMIEKRINDGTKKVLNDMRALTRGW